MALNVDTRESKIDKKERREKEVSLLRHGILRPGLQIIKRILHFFFPAKYQASTDFGGNLICPICDFTARKFHYGGYVEGKG
ncbi:MAG: hypothetical protein LBO68_00220, partial [Synergistaceae bacterium]|nr:hypothetical protein [Synergistaceae bacterium]